MQQQEAVQREHDVVSSLAALSSADMQRIQEVLRGLEDQRTADVWRFVDVQQIALAPTRDVDAFVKGQRSKGFGKGADACKNCGKRGH